MAERGDGRDKIKTDFSVPLIYTKQFTNVIRYNTIRERI